MDRGPKVVPTGGGAVRQVLGETYTFKVVTEDTGGAYALIEIATPPQLGPPLHVHRREEEGFYVLAGEYAIQVGDRRMTAPSGSFAFLPRNIPHTYKDVGTTTARLLVTITPAGFERFLEELSLLPAAGPPDLERIKAIAQRYELELL